MRKIWQRIVEAYNNVIWAICYDSLIGGLP